MCLIFSLLSGADLPNCGDYSDCGSCALMNECAWCASQNECVTTSSAFSRDCGALVFELPCPESYLNENVIVGNLALVSDPTFGGGELNVTGSKISEKDQLLKWEMILNSTSFSVTSGGGVHIEAANQSTYNGFGSDVTFRAGDGVNQLGGSGGNINLQAGDGYGEEQYGADTGVGGSVEIAGGNAVEGPGGNVELSGGRSLIGKGGNVSLVSGDSEASDSGDLLLSSADSSKGNSGNALLSTGNAALNSGEVVITSGDSGEGQAGSVSVSPGVSSQGSGASVLVSGGDSTDSVVQSGSSVDGITGAINVHTAEAVSEV